MNESQKRLKKDIKENHNITVYYHSSWNNEGLMSADFYHQNYCIPLGIVWYRLSYNKYELEILGSIVYDSFRRLGIRTYINDTLFKWYPDIKRIVTSSGSDFGKKWMKKYGYKHHKDDYWFCDRPKRLKK